MIHRGANRYKVVVGYNVCLPSEYQRVEYLESTGTQYIDTGFIDNTPNVGYYVKYQNSKNTSKDGCVMGVLNPNRVVLCNYAYAVISWKESGVGLDGSDKTLTTQDDIVESYANFCNDGFRKILVNKEQKVYSAISGITTTNNVSCYIFSSHFNRTQSDSYGNVNGMRIYNAKISLNGDIVRNMIPCYRKSDSVAGMYDTVNGVFYTNQGTGNFVLGGKFYSTFVPEHISNKYYIRGTATNNFVFRLMYIDDKTQEVTTVDEPCVVTNGKWEIEYSGKKIYGIPSPFWGINSQYEDNNVTSLEFTETLDELTETWRTYPDGISTTQYRCFLYGGNKLTSLKFAEGTTLEKVTRCYNGFSGLNSIVTLDLHGVTLKNCTTITYLGEWSNLETLIIDSWQSLAAFSLASAPKLANLYVPENSTHTKSIQIISSPLTYDSMLRVAHWLADLTGKTTQTVTFNQDTYDALAQEQKDTLYDIIHTQKNWTLATANP